jgi:NADH-quinone oxidoreductase subunit C
MHDRPVETTTTSRAQVVRHVPREELRATVDQLDTNGFDVLVGITAVDYLLHSDRPLAEGITPERFEVIVLLLDRTMRRRMRLRVQVPGGDAVCPSLTTIHPAANAPEREVFDMFGITFEDHPDMTRILMPEEWVGHPLRKDQGIGRIPVQFKGAPS